MVVFACVQGDHRVEDYAGSWQGQLASPHPHQLQRVGSADEGQAQSTKKLWRAIEEDATNEEEDCLAMEAILSAVPHKYMESLVTKATWDALKAMCIVSNRMKKAKAQQLRREYKVLTFYDREAVEDFVLWL